MGNRKSPKTYSDEFKKDAIRVLEISGKKVSEVEEELGITRGLLGRWRKRFQVDAKTDILELSEVEQLRNELRAMKRELEITRMERDVLKKTVGIFSKDHQK